ncbi:MAG: NAD(P)-dependent alcohol dehydrogenase [Sedimentisphaerales bacterium]|nr:NAD(P)-dependent alcohol dehydrogenase [Sedimentisphaerales bacterium]
MKALVLEKKGVLALRDIDIKETLGPEDVRIKIHTVGICGSDVHYYQDGVIGAFVVRKPMVLGHEASGTVVETGRNVTSLKKGDRVCMEPGIPNPISRASRQGIYNMDPEVRFWATPPIHGVLRESVVHPAALTYKLPDNISFGEGAMVEPLAIGMHAATKAQIKPGDTAVVIGAGTIGVVTALSALAGGCSKIILAEIKQDKLELACSLGPMIPVNVQKQNLTEVVMDLTDGWGADIIFEASGSPAAAESLFGPLCPGGLVVYIGSPVKPVPLNIGYANTKEACIKTIFRYAHVYPRAIALMESGKINLKPLITDTYAFADSIKAFEYTCNMKPSSIKVQITMES